MTVRTAYGTRLRRFTEHRPVGAPMALASDHPAIVNSRTLFGARVRSPSEVERVFKSGTHNRKIGGRVMKGRLRGMPIYTLTLEERATCPRSCVDWSTCYGNKMNWSVRLRHGASLEFVVETELADLQARHPKGFLVRLHVLGDFYDAHYVSRWVAWLRMFPALHVYGYTAWPDGSDIGGYVRELSKRMWDRFAVRTSNGHHTSRATKTVDEIDIRGRVGAGIVCPAQSDDTECCATCGLCWDSKDNIVFMRH